MTIIPQSNKRKTPEDYHNLAQSRGLVWLGPEVPNTGTKTRWRCPFGHEWETIYYVISKGHGCPVCRGLETGDRCRFTEQDYLSFAEKRGIEWIGSLPKSVNAPTVWRCRCGKVWETSRRCIQNSNATSCPECGIERRAKVQRLKPSDYQFLAVERGFKWLGPEVKRNSDKTFWECPKGHLWETRYDHIQKGTGCPRCLNFVNGARASKPQIIIAEMLGAECNYRIENRYIDIALVHEQIAIEYDGWYWHKDKENKDRWRTQWLIDNGWTVISIKSEALIPSTEQLHNAIQELENGKTYVEIILDDWGRQVK